MTMQDLDQSFLDKIFPASRADEFFDALFGGAEDGAYDIGLVCRELKPPWRRWRCLPEPFICRGLSWNSPMPA